MRDLKLWIPVLAFFISFAATYPGSIILKDEANYIRQASAFAMGDIHVKYVNPVTQERTEVRPSEYPPGTSLITAPFISIGGWHAAHWMPAIALVLAILFTAFLLKIAGYHPAYSLLLFIFPPALVMARVVSSDVISATFVALGWLLFWKGISKKSAPGASLLFLSGFVAGISMLIRETNALLFVPLFLGALIRKDRGWNWILVGGLLGLSIRLFASYLVFGDPMFAKENAGFSFYAISNNILLYLVALTIFAPGGLLFAALYKGKRRYEVISTVYIFFIFYLVYNSGYETSGFLKSLALGPRFFIPLLPIMALAMAESVPRLFNPIFLKFKRRQFILRGGLLLITSGIILTNVLLHEWAEVHENIQEKIEEHVPENSAVITNFQATLKYVSELQGYPARVNFFELTPEEAEQIGDAYIIFVQRSESTYWRETAGSENRFLECIPTEPVFNQEYLDNYHLKIYRTN
ncbi:MAG: hypothetical protein RI575_03655 [Balneolaceae bacterium]|nr:hypothetical protein [Balneolaceae bacterium]MDR9409982.1 hypothetical protein [Balneolaceae bacterium]